MTDIESGNKDKTVSADCHAVMSIALVGKFVGGLRPCCCHRGVRMSTVHTH